MTSADNNKHKHKTGNSDSSNMVGSIKIKTSSLEAASERISKQFQDSLKKSVSDFKEKKRQLVTRK